MKVLGISGSSNQDGNNEKAIDKILEFIEKRGFETEQVFLSESNIKCCSDCNQCRENIECSIDDDMEKVREKLIDADAIVVSSPVYFGSVSAQLKSLIDRTRPLRRNGFLLKNKIGAAIAIGDSRNGGQEFTIQQIHNWMHIHGMVVVGDNSHFGAILQTEIGDDKTGLKTLEDTANKVCDTLELLKK